MIKTIEADIFTTGAKYIAHQTNCATSGSAAGIAKDIFAKYPYSNCYDKRIDHAEPGTIQVCGDGLEQRGIINMFAQYYPGATGNDPAKLDNVINRKKWFHLCLMRIADIENLHSVAFPEKIACGLAGGDWVWYESTLTKFAHYVHQKQNAITLIYKLPE